MKYAVAVYGDLPKQATYLRNTPAMPDQIKELSDPRFLSDATFDSPAAAATQIARFGAQYDTLGKKWKFEIVRVNFGVTTVEPVQ